MQTGQTSHTFGHQKFINFLEYLRSLKGVSIPFISAEEMYGTFLDSFSFFFTADMHDHVVDISNGATDKINTELIPSSMLKVFGVQLDVSQWSLKETQKVCQYLSLFYKLSIGTLD